MTSEAIRNPIKDQLLTPQDSALIIIDYQPIQVTSVASMDRRTLVSNIVAVARTAKLYGLPIVLSTVNVKTGMNQPTIHQLQEILAGVESFDAPRSTPGKTWNSSRQSRRQVAKSWLWRRYGPRLASLFRRWMRLAKVTRSFR